MAKAKKICNPVDVHVGARVRMRRMMLSMSQEKLGDELDLTFQQVQKYEKGTNRIGASRLQQIANILQVPVEFFFEGAPVIKNGDKISAPLVPDFTATFLASRDGLTIAKNFPKIPGAAARRQITDLIEAMAQP